jgi:hypothetical protein
MGSDDQRRRFRLFDVRILLVFLAKWDTRRCDIVGDVLGGRCISTVVYWTRARKSFKSPVSIVQELENGLDPVDVDDICEALVARRVFFSNALLCEISLPLCCIRTQDVHWRTKMTRLETSREAELALRGLPKSIGWWLAEG